MKAHGTAVGLPSDADMGNSEVGHNALGSGQVVDQVRPRLAAADGTSSHGSAAASADAGGLDAHGLQHMRQLTLAASAIKAI